MERLLYRLSVSCHADRFVLKGASLFLVWKGHAYRVTRDADFLGTGEPSPVQMAQTFSEICVVPCEPDDGMSFPADHIEAVTIKEGQPYAGVRITVVGLLHQARIPLQIDIGFGDVITPGPETVEFPTLLHDPRPRLKAYPRETVVAEKFEAMVRLGLANSRMKDFFDVRVLAEMFDFDGAVLAAAIKNTFLRRCSEVPSETPIAFTRDFTTNPSKKQQWRAFVRKAAAEAAPSELAQAVADVARFLEPVIASIRGGTVSPGFWQAGQGWVVPQ